MCFNLLVRSLKVSYGLCITQTDCKWYKSLRFVHKSQIGFNVKLNMLLYMHSLLVSMVIMFLIQLRNYMVPGQNKPQTLNKY